MTISKNIRVNFLLTFFIFLITFLAVGYYYLSQMEDFLRKENAANVENAACRIAEIVTTRPNLFIKERPGEPESKILPALLERMDVYSPLYMYPLKGNIAQDGDPAEWEAIYERLLQEYSESTSENLLYQAPDAGPDCLTFEHALAKDEGFLYVLFTVTDRHIVTQRSTEFIDGDHVQILLEDPKTGQLQRYALPLVGGGKIGDEFSVAYRVPLVPDDELRIPYPGAEKTMQHEISGGWRHLVDDRGYTLEFRIPLYLFGSRLGFAVADVDDRDLGMRALVSASNEERWPDVTLSDLLNQYFAPPAEPHRTVHLIDKARKKIDLPIEKPIPPEDAKEQEEAKGFGQHLLEWLVGNGVDKLPGDNAPDAEYLPDRLEIHAALEQKAPGSKHPGTSVRYQGDIDGTALRASACPAFLQVDDDKRALVGAVVLTEHEPLAFISTRPALLEILIATVSGIALPGLLLWWLYTSLGRRLRRLRRQAEKAIGLNGTVQPEHIQDNSLDELGEVARSFACTLHNLKQHHQYLQSMAGRLAHELRTPIAVVRSSLENLELEEDPEQKHVYLERAVQGIERLRILISCLTEATRLEQAVQREEQETFDLGELVSGCGENYRMIYPAQTFRLSVSEGAMIMKGSPEMIVQMLDKLVSNATDFALPGTAIEINLRREPGYARLEVANQGPPLPLEMRGRLFESMVSVRSGKGKTDEPHLGLGLYIVRLIAGFHGGTVRASDHPLGNGALFTVRLPFKPLALPGPTVVPQ